MVICKTKEDYDLLYTMRSHGWDRGLNNSSKTKKFNFINSGFNERDGFDGCNRLSQLKRLKK